MFSEVMSSSQKCSFLKKISKTKPILNSYENVRKSVGKNQQYDGFSDNSRKSEECSNIF